jgi:signal transduction histidine kinase
MSDAVPAGRLLVLAPTGRDTVLACRVLAEAGLDCTPCHTVAEACDAIVAGAGALLLTEEALTPDTTAALSAIIAAQEPWSDLPVVVFASRGGPLEARGRPPVLEGLGNVTVVDRPIRRLTLLSVARAALRARHRQYQARDVLGDLHEAVRQRDDFLALLGHELRNPLAAIDMATLLVERGAAPERHLEIVRRQVRQLSRLVDDLLDVSRVTAGKIALQRTRVDLRALAARVLETIALSTGVRGGVAVTGAPGAGAVFTQGDPARLEQILSNLVLNAVKYTPRGGHVSVALAREDGEAVLRVSDDGIGIAPADLARIFDPFVQVGTALDRARGGMGLGLTLVRGLVALHGGNVTARSDGAGRGSTFEVRLPLDLDADAHPEPPAVAGAGINRDILLIEDNDDVRTSLEDALALSGHRVRSAPDGPQGLALARARPPEIALVDIGLPEVDGYEVARQLRKEYGRAPFLVALTGYGRPEDRSRAKEAGFDLHLTKPVDLEHLQRVLRIAHAPA